MTGATLAEERATAPAVRAARHGGGHRRTLLKRVALAMLCLGTLLLSFVAYQLWGTALYEHHAQGILRNELEDRLGIKARTVPRARSAPRPSQPPAAQALMSKVAPTIPAPAVGQPIGLMSIPAIGMTDDAIVEGTGEAQLEQGPGHYQGTALPGEAGNAAIAGHRTTYAAPFFDLNELQPGDLVYIQTAQGIFEYQVSSSEVVSPSDTSVLDPTPLPTLTLTTCNPRFSSTSRLVVVALLHTSITSASFVSSASRTTSSASRPASLPKSLAGDGATGAGSTLGEVGQAVLWGAITICTALLTRFGRRRLWGFRAGVVVAMGTVAVIAALLVCFQHVSLALPETF